MQAPPEQPKNVLEFVHLKSQRFAAREALCAKTAGVWTGLTYGELAQKARKLAAYLIGDAQLQPGERIAILCDSKPEWGIAFFSSIRSGAVLVPLDTKLTESELTIILSDCEPTIIFYDTTHADMAERLKGKLPSVRNTYNVDSPDATGSITGTSISMLEPSQPLASRDREFDEVALIVYTSGTTGNPKGVMTTFGNLIFQVNSFKDMVHLSENDRFLSLLPLNHLLELTGGFLGVLNQGGMINFCHSLFPQEIIKTMQERHITGMIAVPLFFKSLKGAIERDLRKKGEDAQRLFAGAFAQAASLSMAERRKLFHQLHEQFGGGLRVFISGGAPLEIEVADFFDRLGIHILQGYGLTETSPVISGNRIDGNKLGSVGLPLPGVELKLNKKDSDEEGEILSRGPHIMKGYYRRDDQTREVIDAEGWFHTGDIGRIDEDGFLYITGRIKNLIVLGGGKKVFPEEVESALSQGAAIKEICVAARKQSDGFKEGTEEVCAVIVPSDAFLMQLKGQPPEAILPAVKQETDQLSQNLASYKRPTRIFIYDEDELPKTATRKIKRNLVNDWLVGQ